MRILLVVSHGYEAGGAEKSVHMMKQKLTGRGHQVAILSAATPGRRDFSDYRFERVPKHSRIKWLHHLFYLRSYQALRRAVADFRPDLIHFHTLTACTPSVLFATGGVPALLTIHGPEEFTLKLLPWFMGPGDFKGSSGVPGRLNARGAVKYCYYRFLQRPVYRLGLKQISQVIAPSRYIAGDTARDFAGLPVIQIYNGIELPGRHPLPEKPSLLFVGRLEYVKGVNYLLQAFAQVAAEFPELKLRIVGDGQERERLAQLARTLGVADRTEFAGWLPSSKVAVEYVGASAVVIPSIWPENLPTVCIEAMAVGRPVIGTRTGGIPELIANNKTGVVVERADPAALAEAIRNLFSKPGRMSKMGLSAAQAAESFSAETFINQLEELYRQVSSARTRPAMAAVR